VNFPEGACVRLSVGLATVPAKVLRASPDDTVMAVLVDALDVLPLDGHDLVLIFLRGRSGAWYELWTGRPVDITPDAAEAR